MKSLRDLETNVFNKINPAVNFSVSRYVFSVGIFIAIVVFGLISMLNLGVSQLPSINIPAVSVSTTYTGATPSVVDRDVTQIIESAVSSISGITDISSTSVNGSSSVLVSFSDGVDRYAATNQVSSSVSAAIGQLPSGAKSPTVKALDPNADAVIQVGVSGGATSLADVNDWVENDFLPVLQRVNGVGDISTDGGPSKEFQVLLDPSKLALYNLTPQGVADAVGGSVLNSSVGTITHGNSSLSFSTREQPTDPVALRSVVVDSTRHITLSDVASIRESSAVDSYARINGKPVVLVGVKKTTDANTVAVVKGIRQAVARTSLPEGYTITVGNDQSGAITASVNNTYRELIIVSIVVAAIVLLFLGKLNTAIAVILAIPIALSASPILYRLCGFTFNTVSLLALINAIGIVVDDSIVVAENVERYRSMGFSFKDAVLKGASEVFSAVVAATLSLLSVLIPVSFIGGFIGSYIRQFALGLAAAVAFSLFEALLFLTVRMAYTKDMKPFAWKDFVDSFVRIKESLTWGIKGMRKPVALILGVAILGFLALKKLYIFMPAILVYPFVLGLLHYVGRILLTFLQALTGTLHGWTEAAIAWVRDAYVRGLRKMLKRSAWILVGSAVFLVATIAFVSTRIVFTFMPQSDNGTMQITLTLPSSTPIDATNKVTDRIESYLKTRPEVETVQTVVGSKSRIGSSNDTYRAQLDVTLGPSSKRRNIFVLIPDFKKEIVTFVTDYPSATVQVSASGGMSGSSAVEMNVSSADFELLQKSDDGILEAIRANPWVLDAVSSLSDSAMESVFATSPTSLEGTGISPSDVSTTLQIATTGKTAATVQKGGASYDIKVKVDPATLSGQQSLLNLPVYSSALKSNIQVGQLGGFTLSQAATSVTRYNRIYYVQYTVNLKRGAPPALSFQNQVAAELKQKGLLVKDLSVGSGSSVGMTALANQMQTQAPLTFLLALFLAYLVMGAQFNSWRFPLYLLLPVPIAIVGALWMVVFKGGQLDIFGLMGMLMLIGLSAKNAILYLDFVMERIGKMPLEEALIEAGGLRFRPIIMTTLTVLVTSFPLIFGTGTGSEFGQGLGVVTFGGIILSAILTFFVVPAAFYLFEKKRVEKQGAPPEAAAAGAVAD